MKQHYSSIIICCLLSTSLFAQKAHSKTYEVPTTTVPNVIVTPEGIDTELDIYSTFPIRARTVAVEHFEISKQVTLREYKVFLEAMRLDSGEACYGRLLPDSTIGTATQRAQYLTQKKFEKFPVVGVSWINAMRYCAWRSLQENDPANMAYYYRLPTKAEWLAANSTLGQKKGSDFNKDCADWLVDSYFDPQYSFAHDLNPDIRYDPPENDGPNSKRKLYVGNSWRIHFQDPNSYMTLFEFKTKGLPFLGFRCVKVPAENASSDQILELLKKRWKF